MILPYYISYQHTMILIHTTLIGYITMQHQLQSHTQSLCYISYCITISYHIWYNIAVFWYTSKNYILKLCIICTKTGIKVCVKIN